MDFNEPTSYISIISSTLLILSEILPFLPCKPNGIIDTIIKSFTCYKKENCSIKQDKETKDYIMIQHMLYEMLTEIDDLEEQKITFKDVKTHIRKIIHSINENAI